MGRRVAAAPGEPGVHGVGFGAEAAYVEHGPDGSGAPSPTRVSNRGPVASGRWLRWRWQG